MTEYIPVLPNEVITYFSPKDGAVYFDGTFGGGGCFQVILESANCKVVASDPFVKTKLQISQRNKRIISNFFIKNSER